MIGGFGQSPAETADEGVVADEARQRLDAIINEEVKPDDRNKVRARVFDGHPAEALMAAATDADILAVGSRGHGGFAEVLLGSVGQYLVHHANCPVLIFRGDPRHLSAWRFAQVAAGRHDRAQQGGYPWRLVLAVLYVLLLILSLDNTVLDVVLLTPERDRHAATELYRIVNAVAGLSVLTGSPADRVIRRSSRNVPGTLAA
jgi:hypothetical protein